ncbi:X-Pro dipeptidyl-peptidase [Kitasatospora sp. MMS16-BH015]|uniref:CocE/NonD family hydrolase n=1 Tax=Kitasatospora sp. MMS16-BH015 TaxID=2018025 RepID=UPI000CA2F6BF|nr:CocE/NonD family hydrolase [Kitasatospora sp. MMS16-BH015]AUG75554.1 X-Pro dipeptidyl-peptidase [Kitasatospora sp. MMS16-BH015]
MPVEQFIRPTGRTTTGSLLSRAVARLLHLPPATRTVRVTRDLRVPMRDGVDLLADHYAPADGGRPPTLLVRNLYGWDLPIGFLYGRLYAERGYQVLVQRCRGTFGSGGTLDPWVHEAADGLDTVEWLNRQPWYSGEFATIGASYLGYVQWALLADPPPGHRGAVIQMGPHEYSQVAWPGGAFALDTMAGWASMLSHPKRGPLRDNLRQLREQRRLRTAYGQLPLAAACRRALGRDLPHLDAWLAHPGPDDPYWAASDHSRALGAGSAVPVLLQGNWYDAFLAQTLQQYTALRASGAAPRLTVGPWTHTAIGRWWPTFMADSLRRFDELFAGRRPSEAAEPSERSEAAEVAEPSELAEPVRLFVLGADRWRGFTAWPPPQAVEQRWYLHPHGGLALEPPTPGPPSRYRYDPADPTPAVGGAWTGPGAGPRDNRRLEARPDVLTFTSTPLAADLDAIGPVAVELYVRSSLPHTDFFARLCDVHPDGRSVNITDGLRRISTQGSAEVHRIRFELAPTACRFRAGHRIRLQISSGAHPRFARNPGTGEPTGSAARQAAAEQELHHRPDRPSVVVLSAVPS